MTKRMQCQLEQTRESATLYLAGGLGEDDLSNLVGVCDALPPTIRTIRLDLHAIGTMTAESTAVVRQLLGHWRASRRGEFRLSTSHLVATCRPVAEPERWTELGGGAAWVNEALAGTYL